MKHEYSTYILIIFTGLMVAGIVYGNLQSEDLDEICKIDNKTLYRINGNWSCAVPPYIPYIGATTDVDLNTKNISVGKINYNGNISINTNINVSGCIIYNGGTLGTCI